MLDSDPTHTTVTESDPTGEDSSFTEVEIDGEVDRSGELGTGDVGCVGEFATEFVDELMVPSVFMVDVSDWQGWEVLVSEPTEPAGVLVEDDSRDNGVVDADTLEEDLLDEDEFFTVAGKDESLTVGENEDDFDVNEDDSLVEVDDKGLVTAADGLLAVAEDDSLAVADVDNEGLVIDADVVVAVVVDDEGLVTDNDADDNDPDDGLTVAEDDDEFLTTRDDDACLTVDMDDDELEFLLVDGDDEDEDDNDSDGLLTCEAFGVADCLFVDDSLLLVPLSVDLMGVAGCGGGVGEAGGGEGDR